MSTYIERMEDEHKELSIKIEKLLLFIESDNFETIVTNSEARGLMMMQYDAMNTYQRILNKRIKLSTEE